MSTITSRDDSMTTHPAAPVEPGAQVKRPVFVAPKSVWKQINWRMVLLIAIILALPFFIFFQWARQAFHHGIIDHGSYAEVNLKSMSSFDMDQFNGQPTDIPAIFRALDGRRVMMDGQMYAPNSASDGALRNFLFCYNRAKCCLSGPILAQHMVESIPVNGCQALYTDGMARVWGTLHIRFNRDKETHAIHSVYEVDVDKVEYLD
jgi:hypothetical protein